MRKTFCYWVVIQGSSTFFSIVQTILWVCFRGVLQFQYWIGSKRKFVLEPKWSIFWMGFVPLNCKMPSHFRIGSELNLIFSRDSLSWLSKSYLVIGNRVKCAYVYRGVGSFLPTRGNFDVGATSSYRRKVGSRLQRYCRSRYRAHKHDHLRQKLCVD